MHQINHTNLEQKININYELRGTYNINSQIKFKTRTVKSIMMHNDVVIMMHIYLLTEL